MHLLRIQIDKELRDLVWLGFGVAFVAAALTAWFAKARGIYLPLFNGAERELLVSVAALCLLPLVAEAFSIDQRTGMARAQRGWPIGLATTVTSKCAALLLFGGLIVVAMISTMTVATLTGLPWCSLSTHQLNELSMLVKFAAPPAFGVVALVALVSGHSLAALLAGIAVLVLPPALGSLFEADASMPYWVARLFGLHLDMAAPLAGWAWFGLLFGTALLLLSLRGRAARSLISRVLHVTSAALLIGACWWGRDVPNVVRVSQAQFDDPHAQVEWVLPSPDGSCVALSMVRHTGDIGGLPSLWLIDLVEGNAPAKRLSTLPVARATGLGLGPEAQLLDWSTDGAELVGTVGLAMGDASRTSWGLDPDTLDVRPMSIQAEQDALGSWLRRARAPESMDGAQTEVWSFRDGSHPLTVPCTKRLAVCRGARGLGYTIDEAGRVLRVDLLAGEVRDLGISVAEDRFQPRVSDDGKFLVQWSGSGNAPRQHTLTDSVTGDTIEFRTKQFHFGNPAAPVLVRLDAEGGANPDYPRTGTRFWRIITFDGPRDLDFGFALRDLYPLPDGRWLSRSLDRCTVTLHAANGAPQRTLRGPSPAQQPN